MDSKTLLEQAEEYYLQLQYEQAAQIYQSVLGKEPNNTVAMDGMGLIYLEMGQVDQAKQMFLQSIRVAPLTGHEKYLNLAQLSISAESVEYYKKGIQILEIDIADKTKTMNNNTNREQIEEELSELKSSVSSAYCAIVEVYLTDSCFENDAELICQQALDCAIKYDEQNPEAHQLMASFRISQQRNEEALTHLEHSYSIWSKAALLLDEESEEEHDFEEQLTLPSYEFRTTTAKLFLELDKPETALQVLERLVAEDDTIPEVLYLLSVCILKSAPSRHPKEALHTLELAQNLLKDDNSDDVKDMKLEIESLIKLVNTGDDMEEDDNDDNPDMTG